MADKDGPIGTDTRRVRKSPDFQSSINVLPGVISRERSFVRTSNQNNINKRRSLAFNVPGTQPGQLRGKPALDIYRPPNVRGEALNKLNVNAQEFTMALNPRSTTPTTEIDACSSMVLSPVIGTQQSQFVTGPNAAALNRRAALSAHTRSILVQPLSPLAVQGPVPLLNSPSSGNILHATGVNRVKFAAEPQRMHHNRAQNHNNNNNIYQQQHHAAQYNGALDPYINGNNSLQRSKSLSSADSNALTRGMASLGLGLANELDIGQFTPEVQTLIDTALDDPNKLNSRCLMELTSHFIKRAVEGRRFALPISRLCLNIIAREQKETFLEALLNTCRQWYQEREKLLFVMQGMKSPSRVRFTAFMAFLTEMFCQLKRRQLQLRTQHEGAPPPLVLLTLLSKCCEDCVRPPVRSLAEIECLFYVLTCIGQDMESQLPQQQLEIIMSLVRDAFLNASDSAPAIRRTLLQLIELKASHWQLPGNTVLYYYPTAK